jgi:heat shock protein HslJ
MIGKPLRPNRPRPFCVVAVLLCVSALASCGDDLAGPSALQGGEWRLQSMQARDSSVITIQGDPSRFTVEFGGDGRLSVRADCNGCGGNYSVDGSALRVSSLACTLILCPSAPLDARYLGALQGARAIDVDDGTLRIDSVQDTLVFRR